MRFPKPLSRFLVTFHNYCWLIRPHSIGSQLDNRGRYDLPHIVDIRLKVVGSNKRAQAARVQRGEAE